MFTLFSYILCFVPQKFGKIHDLGALKFDVSRAVSDGRTLWFSAEKIYRLGRFSLDVTLLKTTIMRTSTLLGVTFKGLLIFHRSKRAVSIMKSTGL